MKAKILITMLGMSAGIAALAAPVTPEEALSRALESAPRKMASKGAGAFRLAETVKASGNAALYLYEKPQGGYLVLSADDATPLLLGYSEQGVLATPEGEANPEFRYWVETLSRQVAYAVENAGGRGSRHRSISSRVRPQRESIAPLCKTQWSQTAPYNNRCPMQAGYRTVTGCVATAMAQVMKYHRWPEAGMGDNIIYTTSKGLQVSCRISKYTFDWDNMLNTYYDGYYDDTEAGAVAELMFCAGASVQMNYTAQSSGAQSFRICKGLGTNFGYDKGMRCESRDAYYLYDWEDLVYDNLKNVGPLIYDGQSYEGGHSFVCDGYDKDGYFHFNWGWGGMSDGYFLLDALDPMEQGTGGSLSGTGFNFAQDIIVGIKPDKAGTSTWSGQLATSGAVTFTRSGTYLRGSMSKDATIYNCSDITIDSGYFYLQLNDAQNKPVTYIQSEESLAGLGYLYGYNGFSFNLNNCDPGTYICRLYYKANGSDYIPLPLPVYNETSWQLVREKAASMSRIEAFEREIPELHDAKYPEVIKNGGDVEITGTMVNGSSLPWFSNVSLLLIDDAQENLLGAFYPTPYDIEEKTEAPFTYKSNMMAAMNAGDLGYVYAVMAVEVTGEYLFLTEPVRIAVTADGNKPDYPDTIDVDEIITGEDGDVEYYTLAGVRVAVVKAGEKPALPRGIYIRKAGAKAGKVAL